MSLFTRSLILADVPPPEGRTSNFNYCVKIGNLKKYPNHLFFAQTNSFRSSETASPYVLIRGDRCLKMEGYRPFITIGTISKNKVTSKDLKKSGAETILINPKLVKSLVINKEEIDRPHSVPNSEQGKNIVGVYEIKSIDKTGLKLTQVNNDLTLSNYIVFPIVGVAILGWIAWNRQQKTVS